jgi:hypothetical protein
MTAHPPAPASGPTLTPTRLLAGTWEGVLSAPGDTPPRLAATHLGQAIDGVTLTPLTGGQWAVRVPVPPEAIADGVQTIVIAEADSGTSLASFTLVAGDPLAEDLRAEIALLRAELDMLKQAFRRHAAAG